MYLKRACPTNSGKSFIPITLSNLGVLCANWYKGEDYDHDIFKNRIFSMSRGLLRFSFLYDVIKYLNHLKLSKKVHMRGKTNSSLHLIHLRAFHQI